MSARPQSPPAGSVQPATRKADRTWEVFGAENPYFGGLTDPRYLGQELAEAHRAEFFATGERHVERLLATVRRFLDPAFAPARALDFGCGVGRIAIPLARICERVTAVDISPSMLREAARNAELAGLSNLEFVGSDDRLSGARGEYDLIHSYIVLQHLGTGRGLAAIGQLLDRVAPNGVAALHIQYHRRESTLRGVVYRARRDLALVDALLRRVRSRGRQHGLMQMNSTPLVPVFEALQRGGFGQVHVEFSNDGNENMDILGAFVFARRVVEPRW